MSTPEPPYGYDQFGNPITEEYVAEAVREAEAGYDPSTLRVISRRGASVTIPDELQARLAAEAVRRGTTMSHLTREALEQFLAS